MGKEGAVDREFIKVDKEYAKSEYNRGWRAYQKEDGKPFFQIHDGAEFKVYGTMDVWYALRAYQDEQRKKGVPITLSHHGEIRWFQRDYSNFNFLTTDSNEPYILCDEARFTNFRWRAGYPKETQKQTI